MTAPSQPPTDPTETATTTTTATTTATTTTTKRPLFARLGRFAVRRRWTIVIAYAVLLPIALSLGGPVLSLLRAGGFEDYGAESWRVRDELISELGVGVADVIALYSVKGGGNVDDIEVLNGVLGSIDTLEKDKDVVRVISYYTTGATALVSKDRTRTFVVVNLSGDDQHKSEVFNRLRKDFDVEGVDVSFAGFVPVNQALYATVEKDLRRAEFLAFPITAVLLILIFGSGASASMPLILGALAMAFAFLAMRIITVFTDISIFAANTVTIFGLGLAIDYSLFLVSRYREELPALGVEAAVEKTVATTGRAVGFSGITVAASLCGLFLFPQMYLRSIALGAIAVTFGAVTLALTLLPAMLSILGQRVDALRIPFSFGTTSRSSDTKGFWPTLALAVMKRPIVVVVLVTTPLLLLGRPFLRLDPSIPDHKILPVDSPPRKTMEVLDGEFESHQASPHDILIRTKGDALTHANLEKLWTLYQKMKALDGVVEVQGVFSPSALIGKEKTFSILEKPRAEQDPNVLAALDIFTKGNVIRFAVVCADDFNKPRSLAQVPKLRALKSELPDGWTMEVGGVGAILWDLKAEIHEKAPLMVVVVASVMFLVLFIVFGSVTLPIKAMIMNSLSLTASFGALVWVFQDGRFTSLLNYTPLGISDATQPLLMFAVVFGLSMDYEVLLLTRVREEYLRTGDNTLAVARGLSRTGRLITSAAALLVVVIGAFATSEILFMKTLGVGMALAIALDATVIRALLVPAAMRLMGSWNWWAPAPLAKAWKKLGLSDLEE